MFFRLLCLGIWWAGALLPQSVDAETDIQTITAIVPIQTPNPGEFSPHAVLKQETTFAKKIRSPDQAWTSSQDSVWVEYFDDFDDQVRIERERRDDQKKTTKNSQVQSCSNARRSSSQSSSESGKPEATKSQDEDPKNTEPGDGGGGGGGPGGGGGGVIGGIVVIPIGDGKSSTSTIGSSSSSSPSPTPTPTGLMYSHHVSHADDSEFCEDSDGERYSTRQRPKPSQDYQPCSFPPSVTPVPWTKSVSSTSMLSTDARGVVWDCPHATPHDLRVSPTDFDCGDDSTVTSTVTSLYDAYTSSRSALEAERTAPVAVLQFNLGEYYNNIKWWRVVASSKNLTAEQTCDGKYVNSHDRGAMGSYVAYNKAKPPNADPLPLDDFELDGHEIKNCKWSPTGGAGTLKCDRSDKIECHFLDNYWSWHEKHKADIEKYDDYYSEYKKGRDPPPEIPDPPHKDCPKAKGVMYPVYRCIITKKDI